jgi:alkylated DNA repair dioxygenase AlkB
MPCRKSASPPTELPEGFLYQPEFLTEAEEAELMSAFKAFPFEAFDFHGYKARRRVVEFGLEYDFGSRLATVTHQIPEFLLPVRKRAAVLAGVAPEQLMEGIVTEYAPGAPIGWHRDVRQFDLICGISLASSARMRFKPYKAEGKIVSAILEPRSAYVMRGPARWEFQHSIPAVEILRYSITFRTVRTTAKIERRRK